MELKAWEGVVGESARQPFAIVNVGTQQQQRLATQINMNFDMKQ